MLAAPFKVVLDANVLFPFSLRDTLLRAAGEGFFQLYWSKEILDETTRNLVGTGRMTNEQSQYLRECMEDAFPEAEVTGYEALIDAMPNHPKDRHVAAAAVKIGAQVIVTSNIKDFDELPDGIEAQSPDEFLSNLFDLDPDGIVELLQAQAGALRNPPFTFAELLGGLAKTVPEFVRSASMHTGISPSP